MKKTLIASAVAATLSSGAFAMDPATDLAEMLHSMPTFYGNIQLAYLNEEDADGNTDNSVKDNGSTFGIKHSHAISEGVEGFLQAEFEFDADENSAGIDQSDEMYIGVKGDFGSIQIGNDETVYDWVNVVDISEVNGINGGGIAEQDETENVQYVSPEIADGLVVGVTIPAESDSDFAGALAAKYAADNIEVIFAYGMGRTDSGGANADEAEDTVGLAGVYTMDDLTLQLQYETQTDTQDFVGLQGIYSMGQNTFALGYGMTSFDPSGAEDQTSIYLQAKHNVSDNMYVYLEFDTTTDEGGFDGADTDTLALGAAYAF